MAENHEPGKWNAVVCNGFGAVNVLSSINVEELGWDYTEMELDPTGTCGLFDGMLELFARTDVDLRDAESGLMPIHIDDEVSSLSAILLDEEYYRLLVENRTSAGGVAVLSVEGLIPFKAKAWLDLSARRAGGQAVDEKSVKKHRNDVCRLATLLAGGERPAMSEGVRADMRRFLEAYESDPVDPKALKIKGVGAQQVVEVLKSVYLR